MKTLSIPLRLAAMAALLAASPLLAGPAATAGAESPPGTVKDTQATLFSEAQFGKKLSGERYIDTRYAVQVIFNNHYEAAAMNNFDRYTIRDPDDKLIPIVGIMENAAWGDPGKVMGVYLCIDERPEENSTVEVTYPAPGSSAKSEPVKVKIKESASMAKSDLKKGKIAIADTYLGNLLLNVSPNVGTSWESAGIKYGFKFVPAFSDLQLEDGALIETSIGSTGDFAFSPDENSVSTEAFKADVAFTYLNRYFLNETKHLADTDTTADVYDVHTYFFRFRPALVEANQQFTVVNYVIQPRIYTEVPWFKNLTSRLFDNYGLSPIVYAGYSGVAAMNRPAGQSTSFDNRIDMGVVWRVPLYQEGGPDYDDPEKSKPIFNRLYWDVSWDGRYLTDAGALKSFFQTQLNFALTEEIVIFGNYRIGQAEPEFRAVDGFQLGVTFGFGTKDAKTQTLVNTVGN